MALAALAVAVLILPIRSKAEAKIDIQTYWEGYYVGAAQTICELELHGHLPKSFAEALLKALSEGDRDVPRASVNKAFARLATDESVRNCPLPR
jgi:hypothetical protein